MFTKNVSGDLYHSQVDEYIMARKDITTYASGVSEEGCWNIPHKYGSKVSQVLSESGRTSRTPEIGPTGLSGIRKWYTPYVSDQPETLETNLVEQPLLKQKQGTERCRQGCPIKPDTSTQKGGSCIINTATNEKGDVLKGVK
jgi:hypothetical protein